MSVRRTRVQPLRVHVPLATGVYISHTRASTTRGTLGIASTVHIPPLSL